MTYNPKDLDKDRGKDRNRDRNEGRGESYSPDDHGLEDVLQRAFCRCDAPEGFADRVLVRIDTARTPAASTASTRSWLDLFARPAMRWATAAVLSAILGAAGIYHHEQYLRAERERARGEAAKQQLVLALRIAGSKLQLARSKVSQINASEGNPQHLKE